MQQFGAFLRELITDMILDAAQREFQIGEYEFTGPAADDGDEHHMPAAARDGAVAGGNFNRGMKLARWIADLYCQTLGRDLETVFP